MKNLLTIIISLFLIQNIQAQAESCKVIPEKISGKYSGQCLNGLANGNGKSIGVDTYIGTFKDGLPDGKGKYIFKNGDIFQGYWLNGQKNGKGRFEYTLNGKKNTLSGYWKNDAYAGATDPDVSYRVTSITGIIDYKFEKKEASGEKDSGVNISIKSAFLDFVPNDLKIDISSGKVVPSGKKFGIYQYIYPLHCEISYTILVGDTHKQCRFIFDILEKGSYTIILSND